MMQGEFSFDDFLSSYKMLRRMGPLQGVLKMIPGMGKQLEGLDQVDDSQLKRVEGMILSMTPHERRIPHVIDMSRRTRIAGRRGGGGRAGEVPARIAEADGEDDEDDGLGENAIHARNGRRSAYHGRRSAPERDPQGEFNTEEEEESEEIRRMAVKLRLTRIGSKKNPIYRVVAADSRSPRDGKFLEIVGRYNPQHDPSLIEIDEAKVKAGSRRARRRRTRSRSFSRRRASPNSVDELIAELARRLVDDPSEVRVEQYEDDDGTLVYELIVAEDDVGKVIGRQGRLARALRTIVRAGGTASGRSWRSRSSTVRDALATLYDIHGNLAALDAVLAEVPADATIVVGGDVVAGGEDPSGRSNGSAGSAIASSGCAATPIAS